MSYKFVVSLSIICAFALSAYAAPSVRTLGTAKAGVQSVGAVPVRTADMAATKSNAVYSTRPASVRTIGATSIRPNAGNVIKATSGSTTGSTTGAANVSRLSVGKYLHQSGVNSGAIKPVATAESASASDISGLIEAISARVADLESNEEGVSSSISDLIASVNELQQQIANNYYNRDEITQVLEEHSAEVNNTMYNPETEEQETVSIVDSFHHDEIFDEFDLSIFDN